jgi:hypothetical protein
MGAAGVDPTHSPDLSTAMMARAAESSIFDLLTTMSVYLASFGSSMMEAHRCHP